MKNITKILVVVIVFGIVIGLNAQSPERIARQTLSTADTQFLENNFEEAVQNYLSALSKFREINSDDTPFEEEITSILFKIYATGTNTQNLQLMTQYGEEYLLHDPGNEAVIRNVSIGYRNLNNNAKAISVWENYDKVYDSYNAKVAIAGLYEREKDLPNAIVWFNKALEINKDADIVKRVAALYIDNKEPQKAIQFYEDFITTGPSRRELGTTYKNMGTLYKDMNNNRLAIEKYEQFLEIDYDRSVALWLVDQYYHQPNYPKAKQYIQSILQRTANDADATFFNARILYDEKNFAAAKAEFQKVANHRTYGTNAQDFIKRIDAGN